jgi:calcineurin-like phosphoesterase family protein
MRRRFAFGPAGLALVLIFLAAVGAQTPPPRPSPAPTPAPTLPPRQFPAEAVRPIAPPAAPLPAEAQSAAVTRFSFIVYGDTRGRRDGLQVQYEHSLIVDSMLAQIAQLKTTPFPVAFVLQTGDAAVAGYEGREWNASFTPLIERLTQQGGVTYFLAPGNHDVTASSTQDAATRQAGLRNYLDAVSRLIPPDGSARRLAGYPTYAFGYGNAFVIAIDSNIAGDDKQFDWVKRQLEGLDRRRYVNVFAFFHHPPFSSGPHGGAIVESQTAAIRARYEPLFRAHHLRAEFAGHEHLFEHWVERYVDNSGPHRLDHIVTGGGGAPLYTYQGEPDLRAYLAANEASRVTLQHLVKPGMERGSNPYHFAIVRVDNDRIDMEVQAVDWGAGYAPYRSNKVELRDPSR